jgi:hypothetical protein
LKESHLVVEQAEAREIGFHLLQRNGEVLDVAEVGAVLAVARRGQTLEGIGRPDDAVGEAARFQ